MKKQFGISSVLDILNDLSQGKMVILVDDEDRENEGDLLICADYVSADAINFMATNGRGLICLTLTASRCEQLKLPLMVADGLQGTAFTVSIEAALGVTTGISAADRASTILTAVKKDAQPSDLKQPGHVFPLKSREGGVLSRAGHTEAGCDLARLSGCSPFSVICEIMNDDGTMARLPDLLGFAEKHNLKIGTIADLIEYRAQTESLLELTQVSKILTPWGEFQMRIYKDLIENQPHVALVKGEDFSNKTPYIRVQEPFTVLDLLPLKEKKGSSWIFEKAMNQISESGCGVMVMLNCARPAEVFFSGIERLVEGKERKDSGKSRTVRNYGLGAAILKDIGIKKMIVLSEKLKMPSMAGYGLEVVDYLPFGEDVN